MGQIVKVVLRSCEAFWEERRPGLAFFQRWREAPFPTWWTAAPAQVPMLAGWAGGPAAEALLRLPYEQRLDRALETSRVSVRHADREAPRSPRRAARARLERESFARGAYSYVGPGGAGAPRALARPIADTLCFAGEATEPDENGTVPGAIASGRRAARLILEGGGSRGAFRPPRGRTA